MVGRAYSYVITKFSRMGRLLHFLTHGAPLHALRRVCIPNEKVTQQHQLTIKFISKHARVNATKRVLVCCIIIAVFFY